MHHNYQGAGMSDDKKSGDSFKVTIGNVSGGSQIAVGKDVVQKQTAGTIGESGPDAEQAPIATQQDDPSRDREIHSAQPVEPKTDMKLSEQTQSIPIEVFFSYAHEDEELKDRLADQLAVLQRLGVIREWHDRMIVAGTEWRQEIERRLNSAQIILLLISADFLASDFCYGEEMTRAIERHNSGEARTIPIILRACLWHNAPFGKLQALPKNAKPVTSWSNLDEAFENIAQGIEKAVADIRAGI